MIKVKTLKQPILTQSEVTKLKSYERDISINGYRPWVTVRGSHTHGQGHIIHSPKFGRQHHLLSRGERLPFFFFERQSDVIDILEQFPLPITDTLEIASLLNIVHPGAYKERKKHDNKIPAKTMTTDFLVVRKATSGSTFIQPYSFKYASALDIENQHPRKYKRTRQKIAIEDVYWQNQETPLTLITEQDFDRTEIYNLEFLREYRLYSDVYLKVDESSNLMLLAALMKQLINHPLLTLKQNLVVVAKAFNITDFQMLVLFQKAVYESQINVDLSERIELYRPISGGIQFAA